MSTRSRSANQKIFRIMQVMTLMGAVIIVIIKPEHLPELIFAILPILFNPRELHTYPLPDGQRRLPPERRI